jgi:AAA15 family ATPase/GTPase
MNLRLSKRGYRICDKLNVITGETGAGKSILVDALSLALGTAQKKKVYEWTRKKQPCRLFIDIDESSAACVMAREMGIDAVKSVDTYAAGFCEREKYMQCKFRHSYNTGFKNTGQRTC